MGHSRDAALLGQVEALYRARGRDFFRFALARTGSPELAQDAVQEGFARAIKARRRFRADGPLDAWVARCVINAAHDLGSKREAAGGVADDIEGVEDTHHDGAVRAAVRALPTRQREALFLRFYLDLDYDSIAELLDIKVGTVSATLHAARTSLAQSLGAVAQ